MTYRRVSRLSSPLTAKASTKRPFRACFDPEKVRLFLARLPFVIKRQALDQNMHTLLVLAAGSATNTIRMRLLSFRLVYLTWNKIDFQSFSGLHAEPSADPTNF